MNSLSWFLYVSDVVSGLGVFFDIFCFLGTVLVIVGSIAISIEEVWGKWWPAWRNAVFVVLALGFLSVLTPSKNTMYAIAASEIGEKVAENESVKGIASDATKALQQWIKKQIEPDEKKK